MLRTSGPRPDISEIPPALSAIGPYASTDIVIPTVASMATAAMPMPNRPADPLAIQIARQMNRTGARVDSRPTARPLMMFVAGPVLLARAMRLIGPAAV